MQRQEAENGYPSRNLQDTALVTRVAPSPTGFVHIGTLYAALINQKLARQSKGLFYLRIEDTDKEREVEGGQQLITNALNEFGIDYDEGPDKGGLYGPYIQSQRAPLYVSFALWLLEADRAYPCFATEEELAQIYKLQAEKKQRPGYRGEYALWRSKPAEEIIQALQADKPFVLRFKSSGNHEQRIKINDAIKGEIELPENDLDVPLIKSTGLPTYHLAHVVDDHLMGTNLVLRGDEWLPSAPLHIELCQALNITPFNYAHLAPISIMDGSSKRKLSKRKDESANVQYWLDAGYPAPAIEEYLLRLANSNFEEWRKANPTKSNTEFELSLKKLGMSRAPLLDQAKLDDVSRDYIAAMEQTDFEQAILAWTTKYDQVLSKAFSEDQEYTSKVLTIERDAANRRKDLAKWSDGKAMYWYFFDQLFDPIIGECIDKELADISKLDQTNVCLAFLEAYHPNDDQSTWLEKLRAAAKTANYADDNKSYQADPAKYNGTLADFAKIIRVKLTGQNRSPELYSLMQIMGQQRVRHRLHS